MSGCATQAVKKCEASFTKDLADDWQVDQRLWNEDCEAGHAPENIRKAAEMAFWRRCQTRFGPAVAAKLVAVEDLKKLCLTPEGERYLETAWEAQGQPLPKVKIPPRKAKAAAVRVSTPTAAAQIAQSTAAVAVSTPAVAVSTGAAPPKEAEAPKPFVVPWRQPHPGRPTAADLPPLRPPFDSLARLVLQAADPEDAWAAVAALKRTQTFLVMDGTRGQPYGLVVPVSPAQPQDGWIITVTPGYVETPMLKGRLAVNAQVLAKQLARAGLQGRPVPLAAVNPLDERRHLLPGRRGEPVRYGYPDGSTRVEYASGQLAGVLLHELQHLDRRLDGGGGDRFYDERDAQASQCRFYVRLEQVQPDLILDAPLRRLVSACERRRELLASDLVEPYQDLGMAPKVPPSPTDARLARFAAAFHARWRQRLVHDFLARWRRWAARRRQENELLPANERERLDAQIEQRDAQIREDPWAMVFRFDWKNPLGEPEP